MDKSKTSSPHDALFAALDNAPVVETRASYGVITDPSTETPLSYAPNLPVIRPRTEVATITSLGTKESWLRDNRLTTGIVVGGLVVGTLAGIAINTRSNNPTQNDSQASLIAPAVDSKKLQQAPTPTPSSNPLTNGVFLPRGTEGQPQPTPGTSTEAAPAPAPVTMVARVATLNVLGASHTTSNGNKPGMASGKDRMDRTIAYLVKNNIDVGFFQEFEPSQDKRFRKAGDNYELFHPSGGNAVIWDSAQFSKVDAFVKKTPYFDGNMKDTPVVRLKYNATGQEIFVISIHNPADTQNFHHQEQHRDRATEIEKQLVKDLYKEHKIPVIIGGDANEGDEFFCKITENGLLVSAMGGSNGPDQKCVAPNTGVDQILGVGVVFSNYLRDKWPLEHNASDHPYVFADVQIPIGAGGQNG
jgi:hypothetical protein